MENLVLFAYSDKGTFNAVICIFAVQEKYMAKISIPDSQYAIYQREIAEGKFRSVYFLAGDEPFYGDLLAEDIEKNALNDGERDFNQVVMYGKECDAQTIQEACNKYPMMAQRMVVIVKEAHLISLDGILPYFKNPQATTVLVLVHPKKIDGRKAYAKELKKLDKVAVLNTAKLYDNQLPEFVKYRVKELGLNTDDKVAFILSEYLGNDLHRINNELKKLASVLPKGSTITSDTIEAYVGISKIYNVFELNSAILSRDMKKCATIIRGFEANPKDFPLLVLTALIYSALSKILILHAQKITTPQAAASALKVSPFFVGEYINATKKYSYAETLRAISILRKFDRMARGIGGNKADDSLSEMVYMIIGK